MNIRLPVARIAPDVCRRVLLTAGSLAALSVMATTSAATVDGGRAPQPPSFQRLLVVPEDGVAYRQVKLRTWALLQAGNAAEAQPLAEQLTRDYPRDPENWFLLGQARRALNRHSEAAAAYERVIAMVGWNPIAFVPQTSRWAPLVLAAGQHLSAGNRRAALDLLRAGVRDHHYPFPGELYDEPALAALRSDAEFRSLIGRPDASSWSRDEGWRRDVDHLYRLVLQVRPLSHDNPLPAEFGRRHQALLQGVPGLSDEQIFVGMNRMLAVLRQGHTGVLRLSGSRIAARSLPVQFWLFPEGLFIIGAHEQYRSLIGSQVLRVGETPTLEALGRVSEIQSVDGDMEYALGAPNLLREVAILNGLGIADRGETVPLTLQASDGARRTVALSTPNWSSPGKLTPAPQVVAPIFLRNASRGRWELPMPERGAHYVQLNNIFNGDGETLPQFGARLRETLATGGARNLILDLRHNDGGIDLLYRELLRTLIAFSQQPDARLYVLTGRTTYSAAAALVTDLERLASPIIVGEATSECCAFYGNPTPVRLPYSGIGGSVSAVRWNLSHDVFDGRREMSPHVPVQLTARDYFAGRDPVLETVFRMIDEARAAPSVSR